MPLSQQKRRTLEARLNALVPVYKTEIVVRSKEIDPNDEHDWRSMALGWAIAKGLDLDEATVFSQRAIHYQ